MTSALLQATGLGFGYAGTKPVVSGLSLALPRTTFAALIGPNGSGKSTLLRLLAGLLRPWQGLVTLDGAALGSISRRRLAMRMAYVPQELTTVFPFTALEVVLTGRAPYTPRFRLEGTRDRTIAMEALATLGAQHLAERPMTELSGGEKQLVAVARALAQQPELLLLDEPAASLDLKHRAQLVAALRRLRKERGLTALVVTHDLAFLDPAFDHVFALRGGSLAAEGAPREVLREDTLKEIYEDANVRACRLDGRTFVWSEW
ncbi:MAG TPA: ABC transporter ATP-binding protein [Vicinamibacteria bacterium]|jgi:iron complex transport system ATP-binding protein|nr:ABC transporter ATP-binding protein [Vicinamibacteria bacterium]